MKRNKIIVAVIIIIISLFIAWVYVGMNGLPWKIRQTGVTSQK